MRVIAKRNWGVLGVGTELEGDGDKIDRPFRGGSNGGKFTKETFALGEFEHLTGIEIHCSQSVVEAIRFEASTLGNVRKDRKDGMVSCCVRNLPHIHAIDAMSKPNKNYTSDGSLPHRPGLRCSSGNGGAA